MWSLFFVKDINQTKHCRLSDLFGAAPDAKTTLSHKVKTQISLQQFVVLSPCDEQLLCGRLVIAVQTPRMLSWERETGQVPAARGPDFSHNLLRVRDGRGPPFLTS